MTVCSHRPPLVFLGYRAKRPLVPQDVAALNGLASRVAEVCSVSDCLCEPPAGWVQHWKHNRADCYPTPASAWLTVTEPNRGGYVLFAYWLVALDVAVDGCTAPLDVGALFDARLPALPEGEGPADFELLGFDVVLYDNTSASFSCSPITCNWNGAGAPVNRYGLVDTCDAAFAQAARCFREPCEPGRPLVVLVGRELRFD